MIGCAAHWQKLMMWSYMRQCVCVCVCVGGGGGGGSGLGANNLY